MKQSINVYQFRDAFSDYGRQDQFTYDGLGVLFEYLEQLGEDIGEEIELDVIALCCEYSESSPEDIAADYDIDITECEDDDEIADTVEAYLQDNTSLVGRTKSGDFIYQQF